MASSASSSDNEFDLEEYDGIRHGLPLPKDYPFFPILQPPQLVYHATVQRNQNQRASASPGKKPNCFSKAFKWYTKERHCSKSKGERPSKCEDQSAPDDVVGFASWLDAKYEEFLRDRDVEPDHNQMKMTQTAPGQRSAINCCKPQERRTAGNSSEAGDSIRESLEFILQPKEQDCLTNQGTCCHKSNTTLNSMATHSSKTAKTQSASSICCPAAVANNETDIKPKKNMKFKKYINRLVSGPRLMPEKKHCSLVDAECECDDLISSKPISTPNGDTRDKNTKSTEDMEKNQHSTADAACECVDLVPINHTAEDCKCGCNYPELDFKKRPAVDKGCQTENDKVPGVKITCDKNSKSFVTKSVPDACLCNDKPMIDKFFQTENQGCSSVQTCCRCDILAPVKQSVFTEQFGTETLATSDCQTLPYPINLDAVREYPLFMKILCADKFARARVY